MTTPVVSQPKLHTGGTLIPGEHLYIKHPADELLPKLLRQGEYCNVLTSRQMGKSSLMMQTAALLSEERLHIATPDVSLLGNPADADAWYQGLLEEIAAELSLDVGVEAWWRQSKDSTPNQRLLRFFREEVAAKLPGQQALLWWARALSVVPDETRARAIGQLLSVDYPQLRMTLHHEATVRSVTFSPDGCTLLTGSDDRTALLWDTATGQPLAALRHGAAVGSVAFSPDGRTLLTGSNDGVRLWDAATGQLRMSLRHEAAVGSVAFSPDGCMLLTATQWWLHTWRKNGAEWQPFAHRLLPGSMQWDAKFFFLDSAAAQVRAALGVTGDALQIVTIRLDGYDAEPVQGDPQVLLGEWQKRLGLQINKAGEIVPVHP